MTKIMTSTAIVQEFPIRWFAILICLDLKRGDKE